jgi:hypothetical protein
VDGALYYPYTHPRDETWLKAAALYLPTLTRIAPPSGGDDDSRTMRVLRDKLGFFNDLGTADLEREHWHGASAEFLNLVRTRGDELAARYPVPQASGDLGEQYPNSAGTQVRADYFVHMGKTGRVLAHELEAAGLARRHERHYRGGTEEWLAMDTRLAEVLLTALASRVAEGKGLGLVTDEVDAHARLGLNRAGEPGSALLDEPDSGARDDDPEPRSGDVLVSRYAVAALETVLPAGLDQVRVEQIVQARRALDAEFGAFRVHLASAAAALEAAAAIADESERRDAVLAELDVAGLSRDIAELERGLRTLSLSPVKTVFSTQSFGPPAIITAGAVAAGATPAMLLGAGVGMVVVGSVRAARREARTMRTDGPQGYLLGLREELNPQGVLDRVRHAARRLRRQVG